MDIHNLGEKAFQLSVEADLTASMTTFKEAYALTLWSRSLKKDQEKLEKMIKTLQKNLQNNSN